MAIIHKRDQKAGDQRQCMTYSVGMKSGEIRTIRAVDHEQALSICKSAAELKRKVGALICLDTGDLLISCGKVV